METKTQIFNFIILDKSGSMEIIRTATINGLNESINNIRKAQLKYADTQEHFLSVHTFCGCSQQDIYDFTPIKDVNNIKTNDYKPCCSTPLYDSIGLCLNKLERRTKDLESYAVVVTIITDGYENSSKEFSGQQVSQMIGKLREEGWTFAYMGADHDVESVAHEMNIPNYRPFSHDDEGTSNAMKFISSQSVRMYSYINDLPTCDRTCTADFKRKLKSRSDRFFSTPDEE